MNVLYNKKGIQSNHLPIRPEKRLMVRGIRHSGLMRITTPLAVWI